MGLHSAPQHLSHALSQLAALRGYARVQGDAQLQHVWSEVAGPVIAGRTRVLGIRRGVLHVYVANAPLLSELAGFHKGTLLESFRRNYEDLRVRNIRFRLAGDMERP